MDEVIYKGCKLNKVLIIGCIVNFGIWFWVEGIGRSWLFYFWVWKGLNEILKGFDDI